MVCPDCGVEVEDRPGEWIAGHCSTCHVREILGPVGIDMVVLWNKYQHYVAKGISVANLDVQIHAKFNRAVKRALDSVPGIAPARVVELSTQLLITEAQSHAAGFQRIQRA